ncbi:hypothetical protein AN958_12418 [Leucoagaricus sp. SymC.cos]|nr:hypothetical protein AN958_12418 [Leucoagaricus sp. SymC.cos]
MWDLPVPLWPMLIAEVTSLLGRCPKLDSLSLGTRYGYWQVKTKPHPSEPYGEFAEQWSSFEEPMGLRSLVIRGLRVHSQDFLTHIRHFKFLESLTIEYDLDALSHEELGKIFAIFQADNVHLKRISICSIHPHQIIDYLLSYTGLEHFVIDSLDSRDDSPSVVHGFLAVLKLHSSSLRFLAFDVNRISPWKDVLWSLFSESAEAFCMLEYLQNRVHISLEDVQANNTGPFWTWLDIAMRLPALRELRCDPVTFKTGTLRGKRIITPDLIDPPDAKRILSLIERVINDFIHERNPKFSIDSYTGF